MKTGIIVAMDSEFEALRRAGIAGAVRSGIGKAGAARTATELILKEKPDCIINSGCAGGLAPGIKVLDIVIGAQTAYHDVWCGPGTVWGQVQGQPMRFDADPALLRVALSLGAAPASSVHETGLPCGRTASGESSVHETGPSCGRTASGEPSVHETDLPCGRTAFGEPSVHETDLPCGRAAVHCGLICSGDRFLTTPEDDAAVLDIYPDALACDMESAAMAQVCRHYGVPFLSFRIVSDTHSSHEDALSQYEGFWERVSGSSFGFLRALVDKL